MTTSTRELNPSFQQKHALCKLTEIQEIAGFVPTFIFVTLSQPPKAYYIKEISVPQFHATLDSIMKNRGTFYSEKDIEVFFSRAFPFFS